MQIKMDDDEIKEIAMEVVKLIRPHLEKEKPTQDETLFTVETLAQYLHASKKKIYEMVRQKLVPYIKVGGHNRFRKAEIDRWMESHRSPALPPPNPPLKGSKRSGQPLTK